MIDLSVAMTAPASAGLYRGNWQLQDAQAVKFGVGSIAASPFWVQIRVLALTPTPTVIPSATPVVPGLKLQGTVRLTGRGLAFVRVYRQLAGYNEVLIATTDLNGQYGPLALPFQ
jgi:hypothetical protein